MKLARAPLISTWQISEMNPGASMENAPEKPVRNLPIYRIVTFSANIKHNHPANIGTERIIIVHFFPYLGINKPKRNRKTF